MQTKPRRVWLAIALLLAAALPQTAAATVLVRESINTAIHGDDPFANFPFDLPFDALRPIEVKFDGFIENLVPFDTGARYDLWWTTADGAGVEGFLGTPFKALRGATRWAIHLEQPVAFTPANVNFFFEGGGPDDHIRLFGELVIDQVPEPSARVLFGFALAILSLGMGFRQRGRFADSLRRRGQLPIPPGG